MERLELDDIQGLVAYAYLNRPHARYVVLRVRPGPPRNARAWLDALRQFVGSAGPSRQHGAGHPPLLAIAFTHAGLHALGVPADALETFVPEFRQSMAHPHRARVLGDNGENAPENWLWGAPHNEAHMLVASFHHDPAELEQWWQRQLGSAEHAFERTHDVAAFFRPQPHDRRDLREPFGFRDGISQPFVEGFGRPAPRGDAPSNQVSAGEFVLGYPNQLGLLSLSPSVDAAADPHAQLPELPNGRRDLGRNGTYLAVRELEQDVAAFRALPALVQAKLVGRWPSGAPLGLTPEADRPELGARNDFGYSERDRLGLMCPLGSHVRRSNPRDGFIDPARGTTAQESLDTVNKHRLLRRGRPFQRGDSQGTFFISINANLERQFEFVQQAWLASPTFMGLNGERDFAASAGSPFSMPHCSGRERLQLSAFVRVLGGQYFFLPGLRALRWLATI
ncbi:MAG TPA: Dyp-type peroxidase [Polyangiales bacterium]|nr:Dyp-type peroxidase [Polyangiales bacterium]